MSMSWSDIQVGEMLPSHDAGPITRTVLGLYAGGSGDHNPMHIDSDFARKGGMPDVFAHGMLSMAYLAQLLTARFKPEQIRSYGVRFSAITPVNARVTCRGKVVEKFQSEGENRLRVELQTVTDSGVTTLQGEAVVAI
jgi:acyl dehydratase